MVRGHENFLIDMYRPSTEEWFLDSNGNGDVDICSQFREEGGLPARHQRYADNCKTLTIKIRPGIKYSPPLEKAFHRSSGLSG